MPFPVSRAGESVNFEALPVAKIVNYPLEERDYKPFAQCCVCVTDKELVLRLWAFEVSPLPESEVRGVFYLFSEKEHMALHVAVNPPETEIDPHNRVRVWIQDGDTRTPVTDFRHSSHNGEDLQGVYWGGNIFIPMDRLRALGGELLLKTDDIFSGNFYKTCENIESTHYGSFYPADFANAKPYARESTDNFLVVSY